MSSYAFASFVSSSTSVRPEAMTRPATGTLIEPSARMRWVASSAGVSQTWIETMSPAERWNVKLPGALGMPVGAGGAYGTLLRHPVDISPKHTTDARRQPETLIAKPPPLNGGPLPARSAPRRMLPTRPSDRQPDVRRRGPEPEAEPGPRPTSGDGASRVRGGDRSSGGEERRGRVRERSDPPDR